MTWCHSMFVIYWKLWIKNLLLWIDWLCLYFCWLFNLTSFHTGDGHDGGQQLEPNYHSEACQPANGGAAKRIVLTQQSVVFRLTTVCTVSCHNGLGWRCVWSRRCCRLDHRSRKRPAYCPPSLNHLRVTRFGKP